MSVMDRVADILADAGDLLQDADDLTVDEALLSGEAPDSRNWRSELSCDWCGHNWHGLGCYAEGKYDRARDSDLTLDENGRVVQDIDTWAMHLSDVSPGALACRCDGSRQRLDDTWRPPLYRGHQDYTLGRVRQLAHDHGLDGWAARALVRNGMELVFRREPGSVSDWAAQTSSAAQLVGEAFQQTVQVVRNMTVTFRNSSPHLVQILSGCSVVDPVEEPPTVAADVAADVIARARAGRGTGPARLGPERSRPPLRIN